MLRLILRASAGVLVVVGVVGAPLVAVSYPSFAPAGFAGDVTGSDGVVQTCTACHGSFPLNSGTGRVEISAPPQVAPGETVPVTVTVVNTTPPAEGGVGTRQGFTATVRDNASGGFAGALALTDAAATRFAIGSTNYVSHTTAGTSRTTWTFDWTAPAEGGTATIYAAANAANGGDLPESPGDNAAGDYIYTATQTVTVGTTGAADGPAASRLGLGTPHPNPTSGRAVVRVKLAEAARVTVTVVDGRGRTVLRVADGPMAAGSHDVAVPAQGLAPGTYFVAVDAAGERRVRPLAVAR